MAEDLTMDQLELEISKLTQRFESYAKEERAAMAEYEESKRLKFEVIQQMLNQILQNQQVALKKDPSHGSDSRANKNSEKEVQQEQRPQFINTATNLESISIQILKTNSDPEISSSDSSTQETQYQHSSSKILEPKFLASKIQIQQIQKQQFSNIISTISESTTIIKGRESRSVDQKLQISSNNSTYHERTMDQDQNRAVGGLSSRVGVNPLALQEEDNHRDDTISISVVATKTSRSVAMPEEEEYDTSSFRDFCDGKRSMGSSGVEDGASAKGRVEASDAPKSVMTRGGGFHCSRGDSIGPFHRVLQIVAKPPPLLVVVLPWDREREDWTRKKHYEAATTGVVSPSSDGLDGGTRGHWRVPRWVAFEEEARKKKEMVTGEEDILAPVAGAVPPVAACLGEGVAAKERSFWKKVKTEAAMGLCFEIVGLIVFTLGPATIVAENSVGSEYFLQFLGQGEVVEIHGRKPIYFNRTRGFYFKQWDPGNNFYFLFLEVEQK